MPKEIITNGPYVPDDPWIEVGWARDFYVQLGVRLTDEKEGGIFCEVDREGINKLIRVLRRARDQAYGKDE